MLSRRPRHVRVAMMGRGYDDDALRVFAAFTAPPTTTRKTAINNMVVALKVAGVWPLLDILYVLAAADTQAAKINWKLPGTKTLTNVGAGPTFVADQGYTSNGSSTALTTGWVPSTDGANFIQDSASIWMWSLTNAAGASGEAGSVSVDPVMFLQPRNAGNLAVARLNAGVATSVNVANSDSAGMFGGQRRSSTDIRLWKNGAQIQTASVASTGVPTQAQWLCGGNASNFGSRQIAFGAWGASLSGREAVFYTAVQSYLSAVGAI